MVQVTTNPAGVYVSQFSKNNKGHRTPGTTLVRTTTCLLDSLDPTFPLWLDSAVWAKKQEIALLHLERCGMMVFLQKCLLVLCMRTEEEKRHTVLVICALLQFILSLILEKTIVLRRLPSSVKVFSYS